MLTCRSFAAKLAEKLTNPSLFGKYFRTRWCLISKGTSSRDWEIGITCFPRVCAFPAETELSTCDSRLQWWGAKAGVCEPVVLHLDASTPFIHYFFAMSSRPSTWCRECKSAWQKCTPIVISITFIHIINVPAGAGRQAWNTSAVACS